MVTFHMEAKEKVDKTQHKNTTQQGRGFKSHPSKMPVMFFHSTRENTEYTVLTHIGVWVKNKINILYPRCKFNIYYNNVC